MFWPKIKWDKKNKTLIVTIGSNYIYNVEVDKEVYDYFNSPKCSCTPLVNLDFMEIRIENWRECKAHKNL